MFLNKYLKTQSIHTHTHTQWDALHECDECNDENKTKKKTTTTTSHRKYIKISIKLLETIPSGFFFFLFVLLLLFLLVSYIFVQRSYNATVTVKDLDSSSCFKILSSGYRTVIPMHETIYSYRHAPENTQEDKWKQTIRKSSEKSKNFVRKSSKTCAKREIDIFFLLVQKTFPHNHIYLLVCSF